MKAGQKKPGTVAASVVRNKKASFEFELLDKYEAGIELKGTEVKSLRARDASLSESFARPRGRQLYLLNMHISPYDNAADQNHDPTRPRRLLLHRKEITRIIAQVEQRGCTIVPLSVYFKHGLAKVEIAVARGKRKYDKRESIKKRDAERQMRQASARRR